MKEIKAYVQPFVLYKVVRALHEISGLPGCTVSEARAYPRSPKGLVAEDVIEWTGLVCLHIVVADKIADRVVGTIQKAAHTGSKTDGKIFVTEVVEAVNVRTNERGEKTL
ncbi:MAG: P-II family nitrogen regulator [Elusimicrobia bacterium]|nr:P-II family nitrogen regulator [Elusimicrobiota bacterium]